MFGYDPAHSGYNPDETQAKPPLRLKSDYTPGGLVWSCPAVANRVVYLGSADKKPYALDATPGALLWTYTAGTHVHTSPAVANGVV
ncbi:MAG: PQQ-binding-like beta-propeller repeat protein [Dehalococcoidia bacterium]|nr:PQQ-binding-like beta-propeller repeat protein [Dehalococcoidia bacterium]